MVGVGGSVCVWVCVEKESGAGPADGGRMAPERTEPAEVCLHASSRAHKSIRTFTAPGSFKFSRFIIIYKCTDCQLTTNVAFNEKFSKKCSICA